MTTEGFTITSDDGDAGSAMARSVSSSAIRKRISSVFLRGVKFAAVSREQCINHMMDELKAGRGGTIITLNLDHLRRCETDPTFRSIVDQAEVTVADGMPIVWACRMQRTPVPQRVAGSDLIDSLSYSAALRGYSIFLLGGNPGTAQGTARLLEERYPRLKIAGWYEPPLGFEQDPQAYTKAIEMVREANPDIVFVALGSPKQERFIQAARDGLPQTWWLGIGISFSFLSGEIRRAPKWMQKCGLEWMHRLVQEPRRLFKRYIIQGLPFVIKLFFTSLICGIFQRSYSVRGSEPVTAQQE
jgi:N-acetylglucosaminyldiphosphoundecaprenol N-acetyl-beta-D-mannosaminyltransferase